MIMQHTLTQLKHTQCICSYNHIIHTHSYILTVTQTHTFPLTLTHAHSYTLTHSYTHIHTCLHLHSHTHTRTQVYLHTLVCTHPFYTQIHPHTFIGLYVHSSYIHVLTNTVTHCQRLMYSTQLHTHSPILRVTHS